ncbi:MAG: GNAT family N-acetyltransferase [Rhodospirillaceae bacterium]|nr:GNAT family N-acetyltransferase [Rhodospirillaceae bacterium]
MSEPTIAIEPTFDAAMLAALHGATHAPAWDTAAFARLLAQPGVRALIARGEKGDVGLALVRAVADEAEILTIGVIAAARRHGVGRALLRAALDELADASVAHCHLEVGDDNAAAIALYRRCGVAVTGRRTDYYARPDGRADALIMSRAIAAPAGTEGH